MKRLVIGLATVLAALQLACTPEPSDSATETQPTSAKAAQNEPAKTGPIRLTQGQLPFQKLHILKKGDVISYVLPNGRRLVYGVRQDSGFAEQTTASGLKTSRREPEFEELKDYGVSTSGNSAISIYSFDIDGYHVDVAEDLRATHNLPVVLRVTAGPTSELEHGDLRDLFDKEVPKESGPPPRVPISTVHHEMNQKFEFPVRLVLIDRDIQFDVSGDVHAMKEEDRVSKLTSLMDYVVQRYDGIGRITRFTIEVLKDDAPTGRYEARKSVDGRWTLHKQ